MSLTRFNSPHHQDHILDASFLIYCAVPAVCFFNYYLPYLLVDFTQIGNGKNKLKLISFKVLCCLCIFLVGSNCRSRKACKRASCAPHYIVEYSWGQNKFQFVFDCSETIRVHNSAVAVIIIASLENVLLISDKSGSYLKICCCCCCFFVACFACVVVNNNWVFIFINNSYNMGCGVNHRNKSSRNTVGIFFFGKFRNVPLQLHCSSILNRLASCVEMYWPQWSLFLVFKTRRCYQLEPEISVRP